MIQQDVKQHACVAVSATFTAEPLRPALEFILQEVGLQLGVSFAPYNQVLQELISNSSTLAVNHGVNVVLVRLEDFVRDIEDPAKARELVGSIADDIWGALSRFTSRCKTPLIFSAFDASRNLNGEVLSAVERANSRLRSQVAALPGIAILAPSDIDLVSVGERYDDESNILGHVPFTEAHFAAIALAIARKVHALRVPDRKVLVLDCDNTIWRGVVGEDGVSGISIPAALAAVQKFAVANHSRGVLVCLASKNSERDVLEVFESRSDMLLKFEHVVAHRINWDPKPKNLVELSRELNLGLDSFVFIDDNPVECELMRAEIPQVLTLLLPPEDEIEIFLSHLWAFDKVAVTEEDTRRTTMYKEETARKQLESATVDITEFVASLNVQVAIESPEEAEWPRVAQLTQRTNQFNFTTIRRSEGELRALYTPGSDGLSSVLRIKVRDRFGDYGLVGLVVFYVKSMELRVDTFLLSCRVLGRGVEHAIVRHLGETAQHKGLSVVSLPFSRTPRNEPAWAFAESIASQYKHDEGGLQIYAIPTDAALHILHRAGEDPEAVIKARDSEIKKPSSQSCSVDLSDRYMTLACKLQTGQDVLKAVSRANARNRDIAASPVPPESDIEREMLEIWRDILSISDLGMEDDYTALGGTSLLATRLFASITQRFGVRLPLTAILEHPTARKLASRITNSVSTTSLITLRSDGPRDIFLVHDGDGETLLYRNIAQRLPAGFSVFGIEPFQLPGIPLAHTRVEDMAAYCVDVMRRKQVNGPYILGGMCAGGVIAYEMARQLEAGGDPVELVVLLDAAKPTTPKRLGRIAKQRMGRLAQLFTNQESHFSKFELASAALRKLFNAAIWEIISRVRRLSVVARFRLLRFLLPRGQAWPRLIPSLTIRQIYDSAEASYEPSRTAAPTLLVRARAGHGGDTPFREIYADDNLGWASVTEALHVEDVDGGHFTMLQEPFAGSVAQTISDRLGLKRISIDRLPRQSLTVDAA
jgi:FkbH-like protein